MNEAAPKISTLQEAVSAAESRWRDRWSEGPTEGTSALLSVGTLAPDVTLLDEGGVPRRLSKFWSNTPALILFWRHFGCSCGAERARRLLSELDAYNDANLTPVIITQGEPERAAHYAAALGIPCAVLCDPQLDTYRAFGVGHWAIEQVLYDAPPEYWDHDLELGVELQNGRRDTGRTPVDDPWRATAEFVVGTSGLVRLAYDYQYCDDFPDPRVLTTAAKLS